MKTLARTLVAVSLVANSYAFAAPTSPSSKSPTGPSQFTLTPSTLRGRMVAANTSVLIGLNSVYRAKEEVNIARGNLLPSINAGAMLSVAGVFSLTSVSFLLPFLLPSNWFNLDVSEAQLTADGISFYLVELNQFASAYSLYATVLGDIQLRAVYARQAANLEEVRRITEAKESVGDATRADLDRATGLAKLARNQVSQLDALIRQEKASLRKFLALPLTTQIDIDETHVSAVKGEDESPISLLSKVHPSAPETQQLNALITAGRAATESAVYSFLTGASFNVPGDGSKLNWSGASLNGAAGIGFGYFPQIRLNELAVDELRIRRDELKLEQARVLESTLFSISEARRQYAYASEAEESLTAAYNADLENYRIGAVDVLKVLDSANGLTNSALARIRARVELDGQRISLQRILRVGEFAGIKTCVLKPSNNGDWFSGFFDSSDTKITVDQVCRRAQKRK